MSEYSEIEKENRNESVSQEISQNTNGELDSYEFNDNRTESNRLKTLQMKADNSSKTNQLKVFQLKANNVLQFNPEEEDFSRDGRDAMDEGQIVNLLDDSIACIDLFNDALVDAHTAEQWSKQLAAIHSASAVLGAALTALAITGVVIASGGTALLPVAAAATIAAFSGAAGIGGAVAGNRAESNRNNAERNMGARIKGENNEDENGNLYTGQDAAATAVGGGLDAAGMLVEGGKKSAEVLGVGIAGPAVGALLLTKNIYDAKQAFTYKAFTPEVKKIMKDEIKKIQIVVLKDFWEFPPVIRKKYSDKLGQLTSGIKTLLSKMD